MNVKLTPEQLEKAAEAIREVGKSKYDCPWRLLNKPARQYFRKMITAAFSAIEPEPVDVPGNLVEKMLDLVLPRPDSWRDYCDEDRREFRKGMTAALRVVLADPRVLGEPSDGGDCEEFSAFDALCRRGLHGKALCDLLASRRARLTQPKTPEERVTVERVYEDDGQHEDRLFHDGKEIDRADMLQYARLGLIAKLKEQNQ